MKKKLFNSYASSVLLLIFAISFFNPLSVYADDKAQSISIEKLDKKRNSFYLKKKELMETQTDEIQQLQWQIQKLKPIKELSNNKSASFSNFYFYEARAFSQFLVMILFPGMFFNIFLGFGEVVLYFLYPVTIINSVLFLYFRERELFIKRKKIIFIIAASLFFLFASPALVQANENTEKLIFKISETERIINLPPLEKEIRILESYKGRQGLVVEIPKIKIENPDLKPLDTVQIGKWSYYYTLATLYNEADQLGAAVDNLGLMFKKLDKKPTKLQMDSALNSIHFLLKNDQISLTSQSLSHFIPTIYDLSVLLNLTDYLLQYHMDDSAKQALNQAIKIADNEAALLQLSQYHLDKGKYDAAVEVIDQAIQKTRSKDKLVELIKFAMQNKMENSINRGIKKLPKVTQSLESYFQLADYLLSDQRLEQASRTISMGIDSIPFRTHKDAYVEKYLTAAKLASERKDYAQAIRAIEKLGGVLGSNALDFKVPLSFVSFDKDKLPTDENISLPAFYGNLQEKSGFSDKAESSYLQAATQVLDTAQKNFRFDTGLNNFFYLWQFYKERRDYQTLEKLDFIFSYMEDQYLKKIQHDHQQQVKSLSAVIDKLKSKKVDTSLKTTNPTRQYERIFATILYGLRGLSVGFLLVSMLYFCIKYARIYSQKSLELKTYGFLAKFFESIGWCYCFTISGLVQGIVAVFMFQYAQIGHLQMGIALRKEKSEMEK